MRFLYRVSLAGMLTYALLASGCTSSKIQGNLPGSDVPLLVVLSGQSNMVGQGNPDEIPDTMREFPGNVHFIDKGTSYQKVEGSRFGPEVSLAREISEKWPEREVYFLKYAVGGTSLLAWAPDWDSTRAQITENASSGPLYSKLFESKSRANIPASAVPIAVLWMQGERDSRFEEAGLGYSENLQELISRFRRDLGVEDLPFLLGRVNPPPQNFAFLSQVRAAQEQAGKSDPRVVTIDVDDLTKRPDDVHYDTEGQLELGRRFAKALFDIYETNE